MVLNSDKRIKKVWLRFLTTIDREKNFLYIRIGSFFDVTLQMKSRVYLESIIKNNTPL